MSTTHIYSSWCGCEFLEGLDYTGHIYPKIQYCQKHELTERAENVRLASELEVA